jgi:hypothetical protein
MANNSNPFYVEPPNPLQALMLGKESYGEAQGTAARRAAEEALLKGDNNAALARLIGGGNPQLVNALAQYQQAAQGVYGNIIQGIDPQTGQVKLGSMTKYGIFKPLETPGFTPTVQTQQIQGPTGTVVAPKQLPVVGGIPQITGTGGTPGAAPSAAPQAGGISAPQISGGFVPKDVAGAARLKQEGENVAGIGQAKSAVDNAGAQLDRLINTATSIRNDPALSRVTGMMGLFPNLPGGKAADLQANINTLKSQAAYAVLQNMRDMSKTGGAVGQVSNYETQLLQSNLASVEQLQSAGKYKEAMDLLIEYGTGAKKRLKEAYDQDYGRLQPPPQQQPQAQSAPKGRPDEIKVIGGTRYFRYGDQWVIP